MIREVINTTSDLIRFSRSRFFFLMGIIVLSVLFESVGFAMIIPLMESLLESDTDTVLGNMFKTIFGFLGIQMTVTNTSIFFIIVIVIKNFLVILRRYLTSDFTYSLKFFAMKKINKTYFQMPMGDFNKYKHGELVNNVVTETQNAAMGVLQLTELIIGFLLIPSFIVLMLLSSFQLSLFMMGLGLVMYFIVAKFIGGYARRVGKSEITLNQSATSQISENFSGMRVIKILGLGKLLQSRFSDTMVRMKSLLVKWDTLSALTSPVSEVLLVFLIVGYIFYISLNFETGYFEKVLLILSMMVIVAYKMMTQLSKTLVSRMSVERYLPSMKLVSEAMNDQNPSNRTVESPSTEVDDFHGLVFDSVCFSYQEGTDVLKNVSFEIPAGKTVVVMGPSGSGKSTIIDLVLGLYQPRSGSVLLGGNDLENINIDRWREKIGYVGQDVFLFHASVKDNIRIGHFGISFADIRGVMKTVGLDQFIMELPDGYDTEVGDRGLMLSGGQRQRISIARALLKKPDILILDEATSALDDETALKLNKDIFAMMQDKTVFVVSHKKDVLKYADKSYYIDKGLLSKG